MQGSSETSLAMLTFKQAVGVGMMPLSLVFLLLLCGVVLLWIPRFRMAGRWLTTAGFLGFMLVGYGIPFGYVAEMLESRYPAATGLESRAPANWIVVLGGGNRADPSFPLSSRLMEDSLYRLVEGIRLHRQIPGSRLIISGGAISGSVTTARASAELAEALGVAPTAIMLEERPRDTAEEALRIKEHVGDARLFLVTDATHMSRAMFYFNRMGMQSIPAPTRHRVRPGPSRHPAIFFPSPDNIFMANTVTYELLGMAWGLLVTAIHGRND